MCDMGGDYTVGKAMVNPRFAVQRKFTFRHLTGCGKTLWKTFGGDPLLQQEELDSCPAEKRSILNGPQPRNFAISALKRVIEFEVFPER
jgi:hypothetical protein